MTKIGFAAAALLAGLALPAFGQGSDHSGRRNGDNAHHERHHDSHRERDRDRRRTTRAPRNGWLSQAQITTKLAEAGIKATRVKLEHYRYEVHGTDASGTRVKIDVHPTTGAVIRQRRGGRS